MRLADSGLSVVVRPCGLLGGEGLRSAPEPCRARPLPPSPVRGVAKLCSRRHPWAPHTPVRGEDRGITAREALGVFGSWHPRPALNTRASHASPPTGRVGAPPRTRPSCAPSPALLSTPGRGQGVRGPCHTRGRLTPSVVLPARAGIRPPQMEAHAVGQHSSILRKKHFLTTAFISHPTPPWLHLNTCCFELLSPQTPSSLGGGRGLALPSLRSLGGCDSRPDPPAFQPSPHHLSTRRPRG